MTKFHRLKIAILFVPIFFFCTQDARGQSYQDSMYRDQHIAYLMNRMDLSLSEIEERAGRYFEEFGTGRGSGYKQYQRWLYERKFHLDEEGYFISPVEENRRYASYIRAHRSNQRSSASWTEVGPLNWENTSGWNPGIGRVTSIAVHPDFLWIIFVSSPGGGIWKSTDWGESWVPLLDHANAAWMHIYHIHIDPSNPNIIYAAVMHPGGGVIKSFDFGGTWNATGSGPSNTRKVIVNPSNSDIVLCTAANGVWRSEDGGTSWSQEHANEAEDIEFKPGDPNIVYVSGTSNTILRSTDNGLNWTSIGDDAGITHFGRTLLAVTPDNPDVVYAVQSDADVRIFGRLYKSTDSGVSFVTTVVGDPANGTNYFGYNEDGTDTVGQAWYDMAIIVNPLNEHEVHIAGVICWKSWDGGFSFNPTTIWYYPNTLGYNHADVHAFEWVSAWLYAGTDGGIYKSVTSGSDWTDLSSGLGIRQVYRLANAKTNSHIITIGAQDNGSSYRQSNGTWVDWLGGDGMDNMISPVNASVAYGTWQFGGLNKTLDGGQTRIYLGSPSTGNWVTPIAMHPSNHDIIYGGWTGIYKSENGGVDWTLLSGSDITGKLNTLVVAPSNTNYIYGSVGDTLYTTSNGGSNWSSVLLPAEISSIYVSASQPEKIWITLITSSNQVQVSTNMGTTFTSISSGLPALAARTVVVDETDTDGDGVYLGLNVGVYYRSTVHPDWVPFGTGLPLVAINELEIHSASGLIRTATYGRGVWENSLSETTGEVCPEYAYVPNVGSNNVSVIEVPSNIVVTTIPVGDSPGFVCHTSTGSHVYISNYDSHDVSVIETASQSVVATVPMAPGAGTSGLGITPDNQKVFVANRENGTVAVIETATNSVLEVIDVCPEPYAVQVAPEGTLAYVTNYFPNQLITIDVASLEVLDTFTLTSSVHYLEELKFSPDGSLAFIMKSAYEILYFNTATQEVVDSIVLPSFVITTSLVVSADGQSLYVGYGDDSGTGGVIKADIPSSSFEGYVKQYFTTIVGGIGLSSDGALLYVTRVFEDLVDVIQTSDHAVVSTVGVGNAPFGLGDFMVECSISSGGPINDLCANAILIQCGDIIIGSNVGAISDTVPICGTTPGESGVWYKIIGTGDEITLTTCNASTNFDTQIHVYSGTCTELECVVGSDDDLLCIFSTLQTTVTFLSSMGTEYYVLITGFSTNTGVFALQSSCSSVCGEIFTDSGGATENYDNDEDLTTTFCPNSADEIIEVTFTAFEVESLYDALYIFNGATNTDPQFFSGNPPTLSGFPEGGYYGSNLPGTFISSHPSGCLTFRFRSDASLTYPGWIADVACRLRSANDHCEDAFLVSCNTIISGSNLYATSDGSPFCDYLPGSNGVWYKIIGTGEMIQVSTCTEDFTFDTQLFVYTGSCGDLECIAGNDDDFNCPEYALQSTVTFHSILNVEYLILVTGFLENAGEFTLSVECFPPCTSLVTNTNDQGPGSLRAAIDCVAAGSTITFDSSVNNQIIQLTSGTIFINRDIIMSPSINQMIKVRGSDSQTIFNIYPDNTIHLENIHFYEGHNLQESAFINAGELFLKNIKILRDTTGQMDLIKNLGILTIEGLVEIEK